MLTNFLWQNTNGANVHGNTGKRCYLRTDAKQNKTMSIAECSALCAKRSGADFVLFRSTWFVHFAHSKLPMRRRWFHCSYTRIIPTPRLSYDRIYFAHRLVWPPKYIILLFTQIGIVSGEGWSSMGYNVYDGVPVDRGVHSPLLLMRWRPPTHQSNLLDQNVCLYIHQLWYDMIRVRRNLRNVICYR